MTTYQPAPHILMVLNGSTAPSAGQRRVSLASSRKSPATNCSHSGAQNAITLKRQSAQSHNRVGRLSWRPLSFQTKRAMSAIGTKQTC